MKIPKQEIRVGKSDAMNRLIKYAIVFIGISILVALLQVAFLMVADNKGLELSTPELVSSIGVFVIALFFILTQSLQIIKFRRLSKEVVERGFVEDINIIYLIAKNNLLGKAIKVLQHIMFLIVLVLTSYVATYTLFDFSYNGNLNFYLPIIVLLTVTTGFSIKYMECMTDLSD